VSAIVIENAIEVPPSVEHGRDQDLTLLLVKAANMRWLRNTMQRYSSL